jgi:hypothetical protein
MIKTFKIIINKKGYPYLFIKLLVFFTIVYIFDFSIGLGLKKLFFKQTSGLEYGTIYSIEETKADILIFGASRAQQQYNPTYFEERMHQTCYNVGREGESIFYNYAILKGVLKRYTPKIIIVDVENGMFMNKQSSYDRLSVLLPFYKKHPEIRSVIELKSPYEKFKLSSKIYPYNSLIFKMLIGNTEFNKKRKEDIKGYTPLIRALNEPIRKADLSKKYPIDKNKIHYFKLFINDCIKKDIKLYFVCSPYFIDAIGSDSSMVIAKTIVKEHNFDFIDFAKDEYFLKDSKLFDDTVHVNINGSKIFTSKLVDSIILKQKMK